MGHNRMKLLLPFYKDLSYSHLKSRERMQEIKHTQNKVFPVPNRKKHQRFGGSVPPVSAFYDEPVQSANTEQNAPEKAQETLCEGFGD